MKTISFLQTALLFIALLGVSSCQPSGGIIQPGDYSETIRIACVGNSITYGMGIEGRDSLSYPAQLQDLLGDKFEVRNFGVSARTLMSSGDLPYIKEPEYLAALEFKPHVVLIKLGTNDTKPHNWVHNGDLEKDYTQLIQSFQALESKPKVVLLKAAPAFPERWGISDSTIAKHLNPRVEKLAAELGLPCIDLHTALAGKDELFPDLIHPNAEGAAIMAHSIYVALLGQAAK